MFTLLKTFLNIYFHRVSLIFFQPHLAFELERLDIKSGGNTEINTSRRTIREVGVERGLFEHLNLISLKQEFLNLRKLLALSWWCLSSSARKRSKAKIAIICFQILFRLKQLCFKDGSPDVMNQQLLRNMRVHEFVLEFLSVPYDKVRFHSVGFLTTTAFICSLFFYECWFES